MKEIMQNRNFNGHRISTFFHDGGGKRIVVFCHGFRGSSIGPNRFFVRIARELAKQGISSLRFDQYGSGNSEGDFLNSSFVDWVETTKAIVKIYLAQGYEVALLGQSMGGTAVLAVAAVMPVLSAIVAWVPDPNIENFVPSNDIIEEKGQIVQASFWQEAHDINIVQKLDSIKTPTYIVQCTKDEYVDEENRNIIVKNAGSNCTIDNLEGYSHNEWTYKQSQDVIDRSVNFIVRHF